MEERIQLADVKQNELMKKVKALERKMEWKPKLNLDDIAKALNDKKRKAKKRKRKEDKANETKAKKKKKHKKN